MRNRVSALHMVTSVSPNKRGQKGLFVSHTIVVPVLLSHTLWLFHLLLFRDEIFTIPEVRFITQNLFSATLWFNRCEISFWVSRRGTVFKSTCTEGKKKKTYSNVNKNKKALWQLKRQTKLDIHWYLCHIEQLTLLQHGKKRDTEKCNW